MTRLLLVPTRLELSRLPGAPAVDAVLAGRGHWLGLDVALCGFGPVDAAAGAMLAFASRPGTELCVLAGIAGTFDEDRLPLGAVCEGSSFRLHGVGAGREPELASVTELGLPADATGPLPLTDMEAATHALGVHGLPLVELLTVCTASHDLAQAAERRARFPAARAEEMEAYAVARAARLSGLPFTCLRAISNVAGDRDPGRWSVKGALAALAEVLEALA